MEQPNIGDNISRYRKEIGLSQEKIAEYMEVSRQAVTKWENNMSKPSTDNLIRLAETVLPHNSLLYDYYKKKRNEGKAHNVALSHVAKKLVRIIYTLETRDIDFDISKMR